MMRYDSRSWTGDGYDFAKWSSQTVPDVRRRPWVRWFLVAVVMGAPAIAAAQLIWAPKHGDLVPGSFASFIVLASAAIHLSPFAVTRIRNAPDDEFVTAVLGAALRRAYPILTAVVATTFALLWLAAARGWTPSTTPADWAAIGMALLVVAANLPVLMAEFAVPMPPAGEQEEES